MLKILPTLLFSFFFFNINAQLTPEVTSWIINTTGETGYDGNETNVQQVQYSDDNVYVSCTCIPGYDIGPWVGNPNIPSNQNFVYKITRHPEMNTGTFIETPMGHTGVWSNGVSIFNAKDGMSFENEGIWNQNAVVVEGISFDECLGHPAPNGEYHHHLNPTCLYDDEDNLNHAPIIGFAFDGFPVYGAYAFANADGTGGIKRMVSSYQLRSIPDRTTLPDETILSAGEYGPDISVAYPLGYYLEDFEYVAGLGDLDEHNGRFCITPDYPDGIYAYFITLDENGDAAYPYTMGPEYYGNVPAGNTGPGSGHNTITESVETYVSIGNINEQQIEIKVFPNPVSDYLYVFIEPVYQNNLKGSLTDISGRIIQSKENMQPGNTYTFDISDVSEGLYFLKLQNDTADGLAKITVIK
ncbi:MAG: YHYH protein [Chitinophagales bacterium]